MTGTAPELAVVVFAVAAPPELKMAVESLLRQREPLEIVVVNSGGGDPYDRLPGNGAEMKVVSLQDLLWPGAARNLGIRISRAPWVAFLASDTIATEGWAAARLRLHRRGHRAVASAVVNSHPRNLFAWACHLGVLVRRLPGVPREEALCYGASYSRELFEEYGEFREDLRVGEDTDFNGRLSGSDYPVWAPSVRTVHRNPTTFRDMARSQYSRGWRSGRFWPHLSQEPLVVRAAKRFTTAARLAGKSVRGLDRCFVIGCLPILVMSVFAYELGVDAGRRKPTVTGKSRTDDG